MGADMLTATIAVPASRKQAPDFDAGRKLVTEITDLEQYNLDEIDYEIESLLPDLDQDVEVFDDQEQLKPKYLQKMGLAIIDGLEQALTSREVNAIEVAGYRLFITGGLSWGDAPTDAADEIWNAYRLPDIVLRAMGFIPEYSRPLSRSNGLRQGVTDTDIIDAIALGLGTSPEWSGADDLEWIADAVGFVRAHPGDQDPNEYLLDYIEQTGFDPRLSTLLNRYIGEEVDDDVVDDWSS